MEPTPEAVMLKQIWEDVPEDTPVIYIMGTGEERRTETTTGPRIKSDGEAYIGLTFACGDYPLCRVRRVLF